jgi:hypothetical protein
MEHARQLLATMVTTTTYGMWLPGDVRGYVDDGVILPSNPRLHAAAQRQMANDAVILSRSEQDAAFEALCAGAKEFGYRLFAVSIEAWHAHWLLNHGDDKTATMVGRLKNLMRQAVGRGRIWTKGYDKRFCFDEHTVNQRRQYIERHKGNRPIP